MSAIAGGFPASFDMFLNFLKQGFVDLQHVLDLPKHVEKLKHLEEVWIYRAAERPVNEALVIC